jgi:cobalt-precorrin-5B (C1)-methyltransferase
MTFLKPRSGYTLPVFACAAAVAALRWLRQPQTLDAVSIDLIEPAETVEIPIEQVAGIGEGMALAITRSDPGDNLDLTRNTPIWALVEWVKEVRSPEIEPEAIAIKGGEGIGRMVDAGDKAAIYAYAQQVLRENLGRLLEPGEKIQVTIILPEGRALAQRTSNAAFGVLEGLSLLGTRGISQPLSASATLEAYQEELQQKASNFDCLVFCVGENGLDLAAKLGINPSQLVKTANWLGPLLVAAGLYNVKSILLFGYHGKLIKLAGGIFHTHHHLADGRLEILTAYCAQVGLPTAVLQTIFALPTAEGGLKYLRDLDAKDGTDWVDRVYGAIASRIDQRSSEYIRNLGDRDVLVGSIMFDRDRQIVVKSKIAAALLYQLC